MARVLGIDVGTNSLGITVRDDEISNNLNEQIIYSSVSLFKSGIGGTDRNEFSLAAQRTGYRRSRKLYRVRRYRKWATLKLLIEEGCCPLSMEALEKWSHYDKNAQSKRTYPIDDYTFQQWIKLDFDLDGVPDYKTPYELRAELATEQIDFSDRTNLFKLGRAMYHLAERRGFKSSKGETLSSIDDTNSNQEEKESEKNLSAKLHEYISGHNLPNTVGCGMNHLINNGMRLRASEYRAIRQDYQNEIKYIFDFQNGLSLDSSLYKGLVSQKKHEGTIFYKNGPKSMKGHIGKCLLEPTKPRCPESRPEFEYFRAWSFINNIRFGEGCLESLSIDEKQELFSSKFIHAKDIKFDSIRNWIEKKRRVRLCYDRDSYKSTINYKDTTPVTVCKVIYRLRSLLGEEWDSWHYVTDFLHKGNKSTKPSHKVVYTWEDVWHIASTADDEEPLKNFSKKSGLDLKQLINLWNDMPITYANLSLKAINNINRFLSKGLIYSEACMLAKLPDIFGYENWTEEKERAIINSVHGIIQDNLREKKIVNVVNNLISEYKATEIEYRQGHRDFEYKLSSFDYEDIERMIPKTYGEKTWLSMSQEEKINIRKKVASYYQQFFTDIHRDYIKTKSQEDSIKEFILNNFSEITQEALSKLYHHSKIEYYAPATDQKVNDKYLKLLGSPAIDTIRNPMALRVLHTLRRKINDLIISGIIDDEETRIVVEVARKLNDANMRWAIERYDSIRNAENEGILEIISQYTTSDDGIRKGRLMAEQHLIENEDADVDQFNFFCTRRGRTEKNIAEELKTKYKLWLEQGCRSVYTGQPISISDLFDGDKVDIEHTLPRSRSFDDSLSNQTVCESYWNRKIKRNRMPSELGEEAYDRILYNIKPWEDKLERLKDNVRFWKSKGRRAQGKEQKDYCIRQCHLWELERDYWQRKVDSFHTKEITKGFRNSQLIDTSIIAKYAVLFLKSVFSRVEVQRGSTTALFRKILGIQDVEEKKDRSNHTHHAVDAYTLTLIPVPSVREKIIELFYSKLENKHLGDKTSVKQIDKDLEKELRNGRLKEGVYSNVIEYLKENVLAIREQKNQGLTPSSKRERVRGKVLSLKDNDGHTIFEKNEDGSYKYDKLGHRIPLAKHWAKGDCIRGNLHLQTYFGAILRDGNNLEYVYRCDLDSFKNWDDLERNIVNKELVKMMKSQFPEGTALTTAVREGIYMLDKDGSKVNKIRHVRCNVPSNSSPTPIRKQTYISKKKYKEYKQYAYASIGDLPLMVRYDDGKKLKYKTFHLLDIAKNRNNGTERIPDIPGCKKTLIWAGSMILIYMENKSELYRASHEELSKRLYYISGFEGESRLTCIRHNLEDGNLGRGVSLTKLENKYELPVKIRMGISKLNFLIEGVDFKFNNGKIEFI